MNQDITLPEVKAYFIARINKVNAGTPALWGKMNASQMLAHCQAPIRVALGYDKLKHSLIGILFGGWARKKLFTDEPFTKNLPTAPSFLVKHEPDFEIEKNNLIGLITRLQNNKFTKDPHPFFGKMTIEEWSKLIWKHMDHHLRQFGV